MDSNCNVCGEKKEIISKELGVCLDCIRTKFHKARKIIEATHERCRVEHHLPAKPPKDKDGIPCDICINQCRIGRGKRGYCGVRKNEGGKLVDFGGATLNYYFEKLPTNCVADNICAGCTGAGYPKYANKSGPETGFKSLAVFYGACSFDCLFCQNWHFRDYLTQPHVVTSEELASQVDERTSCVCFFGGDPTPQIYHALKAAKTMRERKKGQIFRVCFETNGAMNEDIMKEFAEMALMSGGTVKIDLKAYDDHLHYALTGVSNKWTFNNFKAVAKMGKGRRQPPPLVASTLLVPGYIDVQEISHIAKFIAKIDPNIPYCLLAFYPQFYMYDVPPTSKRLAETALKAAKKAGLKHVYVGNKHLLI
ncbi:radical SAM protein [Candidatus Margulisiibacteriota bacterium]